MAEENKNSSENRPDVNQLCSNNKHVYSRLVFSWLQAGWWPIVILIVFFQLNMPIKQSFEKVPNLIARTAKIDVKGVTLELRTKLASMSSVELQDAFAHISVDGLTELMQLPIMARTQKSDIWIERDLKVLQELQKLNLAFVKDIQPDSNGFDVVFGTTELGEIAQKFIRDIAIDQTINAAKQLSDSIWENK